MLALLPSGTGNTTVMKLPGLVLHRHAVAAQRPRDVVQLDGHLGGRGLLAEVGEVDVGVVADHLALAGRAEQRAERDPASQPALAAHHLEDLVGASRPSAR